MGSLSKLAGAYLTQQAADLALDLAGPDGVAWSAPSADMWAHSYLSASRSWIAGGTADIQRTIIGERLLGLPREPR